MSKADTLLKKATFFERMAIYSDRKTFLQALAQGLTPPSDDIRQGIESAMRDLAATKRETSQALQNRLMDFYSGQNTDMKQLADALRETANTIPGNLTTQVQRILDLANKVDQKQQQQLSGDSSPENSVMQMPADSIKALRPIDPEKQSALGKFVTIHGLVFVDPQKMHDGKLGPETRKALNAFKTWYNEKATGPKITSDDAVLNLVKNIVDGDPKTYG
jgi:hypothetical protein